MVRRSFSRIAVRRVGIGPVARDQHQNAGALEISGSVDTEFWPGASLKTTKSYVATKEVNLAFETDRVNLYV